MLMNDQRNPIFEYFLDDGNDVTLMVTFQIT